jgi:peptidylprolyl isomerase
MSLRYSVIIMVMAAIVVLAGTAGCTGTTPDTPPAPVAQPGDTVAVHYVGTLDDGTEFDNSTARGEPLEFVLGSGQMIPGFDQAVTGMAVGETKTVHIPADEAYGQHRDDMIFELPRDEFPEDLDLQIGQQIPLSTVSGAVIPGTVIALNETAVTVDVNHQLVGEDLTFVITLVSIT